MITKCTDRIYINNIEIPQNLVENQLEYKPSIVDYCIGSVIIIDNMMFVISHIDVNTKAWYIK